jgi:hypothetical protein
MVKQRKYVYNPVAAKTYGIEVPKNYEALK